ncbi:XdhC family protein [Polaribacter sp. MSW13]|uniref:XdhC family protein n=1 Tax=Polaribacter marinus TaxID=2916838 RepID=A0A9X1VP21_9FLAO|nr:XdhC family protein [Polaribacter marinus]MCI2230124.1 XdhC family protein [Polaribacter marinus]
MIIWQHIATKLQENKAVYILTVIENLGSSPGRKGFKMMVAQDGFIFGSIGGGVMEFSLVEEAKQLLLDKKTSIFIKKQVHRGNIENGSGMICSGEQTVAFHYLDKNDLSQIKDIIHCINNGKKGTLSFTQNSFSFSNKLVENQFNYQIYTLENWFFEEQIGFKETLYIVGGGHVGVAVSELLAKLGFYIVVIDNRENLNTLENNNFAHKKLVINYHEINNYIDEGSSSYIAIMTNKYTDDKLVLSKLLRKKHHFIGVLGSKAKLKTMWEVLIAEGFTLEELSKVNAPIGLPIKSETTQEIAVSIAAQIIKYKNSKN